jgi:hypothetical protein
VFTGMELNLAKPLVPFRALLRNPWHKIVYRTLPDGVAVIGPSYPPDKAARTVTGWLIMSSRALGGSGGSMGIHRWRRKSPA